MYLSFQRQEYLLPADRELHRQIHSIKRSVTAAGYTRFDVEKAVKHHGDRFWSLALAEHAVSGGTGKAMSFYKQWRERRQKELGGGVAGAGNKLNLNQSQVMDHLRRMGGGNE